jgi:DNA mismatch repair protein MutS
MRENSFSLTHEEHKRLIDYSNFYLKRICPLNHTSTIPTDLQNLTPLMKQYWEIKSLHPDKILLFRMGDFFELFFDDAVKAAPVVGIALTSRNKKSQEETPMCGVPHHAIAGPINKLLSYGFKVAICDQIEDPKLAKGIVKRAVTRILTPGMVYDADTLEATKAHYIASFDEESLSFLDTSTGEAFYYTAQGVLNFAQQQQNLMKLLGVAEVVTESGESVEGLAASFSQFSASLIVSTFADLSSDLKFHLKVESLPVSAQRLLAYIVTLGGEIALKVIKPFESRSLLARMEISQTVFRHLEVFSTYRGEISGSLFFAMNRTQTSGGARLLRQWLSFPLQDLKSITQRQEALQLWRGFLPELKEVRKTLSSMGDIERRLSKIAQPTCNGRDLLALAQSVDAGLRAVEIEVATQKKSKDQIKDKTQAASSANLLETSHQAVLFSLSQKIQNTLVEDPPISTKQGYLIRTGVSPELDELIELSTHSQDLVQRMEQKEKEATGINSLKIRYNNVFGYYIEVTHTHKDKVPAYYQRKQTLVNAERYCTDELIELEKKVLTAQTKRNDLEAEYFDTLRAEILKQASDLLVLASHCSHLDVESSLAWLSLEQKYVRPQFHQKQGLQIKGSRHPVVEQFLKTQFVSNDITLQKESCLLLTGPNMAGKSTLMRQVALTVLLAQMGSYVPADYVEMPIFDAIFTRIGASDQLTEGLSTFMVEMTETAAMIKKATSKSLVVLDEVGRGTSTFDGMCLAQSILEHLLTETQALTLFATHYHELTYLEETYPQIKNAHMTVAEKMGEISFLHTLVKGPAMKSYGIHVGKLAGLPASITSRAQTLLKKVESQSHQNFQGASGNLQMSLLDWEESGLVEAEVEAAGHSVVVPVVTDSLETVPAVSGPVLKPEQEQVLKDLEELSVVQCSPLEALNKIAYWQKSLSSPDFK